MKDMLGSLRAAFKQSTGDESKEDNLRWGWLFSLVMILAMVVMTAVVSSLAWQYNQSSPQQLQEKGQQTLEKLEASWSAQLKHLEALLHLAIAGEVSDGMLKGWVQREFSTQGIMGFGCLLDSRHKQVWNLDQSAANLPGPKRPAAELLAKVRMYGERSCQLHPRMDDWPWILECHIPSFVGGKYQGTLVLFYTTASLSNALALEGFNERFRLKMAASARDLLVEASVTDYLTGDYTRRLLEVGGVSLALELGRVASGRDLWLWGLSGLLLVMLLTILWLFYFQVCQSSRRERASHALMLEKERLSHLIRTSVQGILVHRKNKIVFANPVLASLFGYQHPSEMLKISLGTMFPLSQLDTLRSASKGNGDDPASYFQCTAQHYSGRNLWLQGKSSRMRWNNEDCILTTLVDLTHHKEAEEKVHHHQHLLQTVVNNLPFWIYLKNAQSDFQLLNRQLLESLGISEQDAKQLDMCQIQKRVGDNLTDMAYYDQQVLNTGEKLERQLEFNGLQGKQIFKMVKLPLFQPDGELQAVLTYAEDITQRHLAEQRLQESEKRYRDLFEATFEGLVVLHHERVIAANEAFGHLMRHEVDNMMGMELDKFLFAAGSGEEANKLPNKLAHLEDGQYEARLRRKDGAMVDVEVLARSHEYTGRPVIVMALRDISERKRIEYMVRHFVSMVSHELRTPLTSITGSLGLLMETQHGALDRETQQLLGIARKNCERLIRLTNDILDISRLETGRLRFKESKLDIGALVEQATQEIRAYGESFQVDFRIHRSSDQICLVYADADRMLQVLTNLMSNAAKFSPAGETVDIYLEPESEHVCIHVCDRGPGIPAHVTQQVFSPFFQVENRQPSKGGSGLGLSIAKQIIEHSGGSIDVKPRPGGGAAFYFYLPLVLPAVAEKAFKQKAIPSVKAPTRSKVTKKAASANNTRHTAKSVKKAANDQSNSTKTKHNPVVPSPRSGGSSHMPESSDQGTHTSRGLS